MMVFDFIRKRAEEGIAQVQNIASKTAEGKLAEALEDTATYVRQRQEIDAENIRKLSEGLAKSRARLMGDLDSIFGAKEDIGLTKTLDKVGGGERAGGGEGKLSAHAGPLRLSAPGLTD